MYYSSGNYEAFARPKKPEGVDNKSAYIIGSGLAALTAACYLVRDGQMKGEHVHVLEKGDLPGGACDGYKFENLGYVMRGGREMDNHFEVMWDLFRSIPSLETEGASVLDEYYWLNKEDPNFSLCRATEKQGQDAHTDGKFAISDKGAMEIMHLFFTPDEQLYDKRITDVFDDEVFSSNFWMYWRTMFAFENWHSALEMKRYLQRYIHHIGGLPDFTALRFTRYNQYESMILPMVKYLEGFGVQFHYDTKVTNIAFDCAGSKKQATRIDILHDGQESSIDLTENDLVFITNGGCVENSTLGSQDTPAEFKPEIKEGGGWDLWRKIAAQDPSFGHPDKFCYDPELSETFYIIRRYRFYMLDTVSEVSVAVHAFRIFESVKPQTHRTVSACMQPHLYTVCHHLRNAIFQVIRIYHRLAPEPWHICVIFEHEPGVAHRCAVQEVFHAYAPEHF